MKPYIHKNALASIGNDGLMGNKIINIIPVEEFSPAAETGDVLPVQKTPGTDEMLQTLQKTNTNIAYISEQLKSTVDRLNQSTALWGILSEPSLAGNLKASLENIRQASGNANALTGRLDALISDVRNGKGSVGALLTDTSFASSLGHAIDNIKSAGAQADQLVSQLDATVRDIHQQVVDGQGTVHSLLKDPSLATKLNASMDNIQKGTDAFNQDMEALKHNFLLRGYFRKLEKQQKTNSVTTTQQP